MPSPDLPERLLHCFDLLSICGAPNAQVLLVHSQHWCRMSIGGSATHNRLWTSAILPICDSHLPTECWQSCVFIGQLTQQYLPVKGLEHDWVCRGEACGDSDTWQRGAARAGFQNIPWRPALLQVPLYPLSAAPHCLDLLAWVAIRFCTILLLDSVNLLCVLHCCRHSCTCSVLLASSTGTL